MLNPVRHCCFWRHMTWFPHHFMWPDCHQTKTWQTCFKFLENAMFLLIARPSWILFPPSEIIQSYLSNSTTWKTSTQLCLALPQSPFHCTWLCAFPKHTKLLLHSNCHNYDKFAFTVFLFSVSAFLYTRYLPIILNLCLFCNHFITNKWMFHNFLAKIHSNNTDIFTEIFGM